MQPFLSPARIVLLALVDMYCSDVVRSEDDDFLLQLISAYVLETYARPTNDRQRFLARWQRAYLSVDLLTHVHSLQPALQTCLVAAGSKATQMTTLTMTTPVRCVTLWDHLVQRLWVQLPTLDSLVDFFDDIHHDHIAPTYAELRALRESGLQPAEPPATRVLLDRRSPLGLLVHQAHLEFGHLSFAGRCELWEDFVRYRHATRGDYELLWPPNEEAEAGAGAEEVRGREVLYDEILATHQEEWGGVQPTDTVARIVYDRVAKDDAVCASLDETDKLVSLLIDRERIGFRPGHRLRAAVDDALAGSALVPNQAIFFRLLDAWRMGDANTAYDQLHRYFDLVARQGAGAAFGYNMGPMNKAVIQRDFGEHCNDLLSMLDAVHAGREARDYDSLRFALVWLYLYARVLPRHIRPHELQGLAGRPSDGAQVLPFVRDDADAAQFHAHHALASLMEARVALGDGRSPLLALTRLREASRHIVGHGETTLEGQLTAVLMLFWDRMGSGPLALAHGRAFMRTRHDDVPFDDAVRVACRLALQYAQAGAFAQAKQAATAAAVGGLLSAEGLTSLRATSALRHVLLYIAALQAVRAGRFADAEDLLLRQLPRGGYPSCGSSGGGSVGGSVGNDDRMTQGPSQVDPDLAAQAALLHVTLLTQQSPASLPAARAALDRFEAAYDKGVADLHVLLQAALARIDLYTRAGRGLRVLTYAVRTAQACLRRRYFVLLWQAVGALARLLVAEGEFRAARTLLDAVIPRSLETLHVATTAQLYEDLADACMGMAGQLTAGQVTGRHARLHKQHLAKAWWSLGQAQIYRRRAGCAPAAEQDLLAKRQVIFSVAQQQQQQVDVGA